MNSNKCRSGGESPAEPNEPCRQDMPPSRYGSDTDSPTRSKKKQLVHDNTDTDIPFDRIDDIVVGS